MIRGWAIVLCACAASAGMAQHWIPAGLPGNIFNPRVVTSNVSGDTLYYGGLIAIGSPVSETIAAFRYANGTWDTLGVFTGDVLTLIVHNDTLFAGGHFTACGGQPCAGIAYHDGANWQPYGDLGSGVRRLRVIDGTLYAVGSFTTADGPPAPGVARRVGGHWTGVGQIATTSLINVVDIASHNNELVIVGPMTVAGVRGIFHLVNDDWLPLGPGIQGGLSNAGCLAVYQGDLYVSGQISVAAGNAGKDIMRWDGTQFHALGSSLQYTLGNDSQTCTGQVMTVHDDLLWVGSGCRYAGGVPARGLATWDGSQWCGVPGDLGGETYVRDFAFYRDTLFLAFFYGNGPMSGAAKFIGESYVGECGLWVGVDNPSPPANRDGLVVRPTAPHQWAVQFAGARDWTLLVYDATGRLVRQLGSHGEEVSLDLAHEAPGLYMLSAYSPTEGRRQAKLVRP